MKLTNPNEDRSILASIEGLWYEIPAGGSEEYEDYVVASTLVEYGAVAVPAELQAARELWAAGNRQINGRTASASASEGQILGRQQATVNPALGTVTSSPEPLAGAQLTAAVKLANENGAGISARASAQEKRDALEAWQLGRGSSTPVQESHPGEFQTDEAGELVLDGEGQPVPLVQANDVTAADDTHVVGDPAAVVEASPEDVDGVDDAALGDEGVAAGGDDD